jgi:hypothetical protein
MRSLTRHAALVMIAAATIAPATLSAQGMSASHASMKSAELKSKLSTLLQEHTFLAASATGAALANRQSEFQAAAGALDMNSIDVSKAIGMVYGQGAETAFLALWRKHIGFVVDYTTGVATKDKGKSDKAVGDLVQYTQDFGAFLASANPNLPKDAVAGLVKDHVLTLKAVIDAQASGDAKKTYSALREAAMHMQMIADPLAAAIAKQFPNRFSN